MSWVVRLRRLGLDVYFVEQFVPEACVDPTGTPASFTDSGNLDWFRSVTQWFGLAEHSALVHVRGDECGGISWTRLLQIAESVRH